MASPVTRSPRSLWPTIRAASVMSVALAVLLALVLASLARSADQPPGDKPAAAPGAAAVGGDKLGKLPHITFDVKKKQVRVEAEALAVNAPLEFFMVTAGGPEHETRSE